MELRTPLVEQQTWCGGDSGLEAGFCMDNLGDYAIFVDDWAGLNGRMFSCPLGGVGSPPPGTAECGSLPVRPQSLVS